MMNSNAKEKNLRLCSLNDSMTVVQRAVEYLNISGYRLELLLGCPRHFYTHRWTSGLTRISQPYAVRLCRLVMMKAEGTNMTLLSHVDWAEGKIVLKDGLADKLAGHNNQSQLIARFMEMKPLSK